MDTPDPPGEIPAPDLSVSIDDAIDRLEYGLFQKRILTASGLVSASDAMEILLLSFLSIAVKVEFDLTPHQSSSLVAVVFAGAFIGTLVLGRLGDVLGRKPTFVITASIVAVFGLVTCVCQNFTTLLAARFMVGVGTGGVTLPFDTYAEFLPTESRGKNLVLPSFFWTTGTILVAIAAQATLGQDPSRWRVLCLLCSMPSILATIVGSIVVPESPRWLLTHKQDESRALAVLRDAAALNGKDPDLLFPPGTRLHTPDGNKYHSDIGMSLWQLCTPEFSTLAAVWFFYGLVYYGTILAVTEVFSRPETSGSEDDGKLHFDYAAILLASASEVGGALFMLFTIDRVGRRPMHGRSFLVGGVLLLCLCLVVSADSSSATNENHTVSVILAFFARMFIFSGSAITWIWTAEILATSNRSTGHSLANAAGRVGGFLAPYLVSQTMPFRVIGITMMVLSAIIYACSRALPETFGAPMGGALPSNSRSAEGYRHVGHALEISD